VELETELADDGRAEKTARRAASRFLLFSKRNWNDEVAVDEVGGACSTNKGEERLLVGKLGAKRPLRRLRRSWVDTIKMDLGEREWRNVDCIYMFCFYIVQREILRKECKIT
jgi:hypothetical protein